MANKVTQKEVKTKASPKRRKNPFKITQRVEKVEEKAKPFEETPGLQKIYLYIIVVDQGVANAVEKLLQDCGSSAQFTHNGRGTAPRDIYNILNVVEDKKAVINAFVCEDKLEETRNELDAFFRENKKNKGVGFAIPLSALQGIRTYKYMTQTF